MGVNHKKTKNHLKNRLVPQAVLFFFEFSNDGELYPPFDYACEYIACEGKQQKISRCVSIKILIGFKKSVFPNIIILFKNTLKYKFVKHN